jgi:hypothetical protein
MASAPREDNRSAEFVNVLKNEHMKTHAIRDEYQRVTQLYEAPIHVQHGEGCLVTIYEYTGFNNVPTNTMEKVAKWNGAWDATLHEVLVYGDVGFVEG